MIVKRFALLFSIALAAANCQAQAQAQEQRGQGGGSVFTDQRPDKPKVQRKKRNYQPGPSPMEEMRKDYERRTGKKVIERKL